MSKPDWAERLQRTRKREYEKGWDACYDYILNLLEPYSECDEEICRSGCYPEDCNAPAFRAAIDIIKKETE